MQMLVKRSDNQQNRAPSVMLRARKLAQVYTIFLRPRYAFTEFQVRYALGAGYLSISSSIFGIKSGIRKGLDWTLSIPASSIVCICSGLDSKGNNG